MIDYQPFSAPLGFYVLGVVAGITKWVATFLAVYYGATIAMMHRDTRLAKAITEAKREATSRTAAADDHAGQSNQNHRHQSDSGPHGGGAKPPPFAH